MEFKGTKGKWEVCEHSWSDTSILCGDKTICTQSIYDDVTEENQEELENIEIANFKLISKAPELLECLIGLSNAISNGDKNKLSEYNLKSKQLIKEATS